MLQRSNNFSRKTRLARYELESMNMSVVVMAGKQSYPPENRTGLHKQISTSPLTVVQQVICLNHERQTLNSLHTVPNNHTQSHVTRRKHV